MQQDPCWIDTRRDGGEQLDSAGDVQAQTGGNHHPLNGGTREGLGRERHHSAGTPRGELPVELLGPRPQGRFVDDQSRRPMGGSQFVQSATTDPKHAVSGLVGARREQPE